MKISIALAAYNGDAYLQEQLNSFAAQTRLPDELIVVDDLSHDGTLAVVRDFADRAPFPVRLVVNDHNLGYAQNFGKALSLCSGDLVFLSDQDDVWFDSKIETMLNFATRNVAAACFLNNAMLTDAMLTPSGVTKRDQIRAAGLPEKAFVMGCCTAVRRELLEVLLPIPVKAASHDNWLVEVSDIFGLTLRNAEVLQYYRIHGGNESDFFVNRPEKLSKGKLFVERLRKIKRRATTMKSLEREYSFYEDLSERFVEQRQSCSRLVGSDRFEKIVTSVETRRDLLATRRSIRCLGFAARPGAVLAFWCQGGYRRSGGLPGMLKDLFAGRPAHYCVKE